MNNSNLLFADIANRGYLTIEVGYQKRKLMNNTKLTFLV